MLHAALTECWATTWASMASCIPLRCVTPCHAIPLRCVTPCHPWLRCVTPCHPWPAPLYIPCLTPCPLPSILPPSWAPLSCSLCPPMALHLCSPICTCPCHPICVSPHPHASPICTCPCHPICMSPHPIASPICTCTPTVVKCGLSTSAIRRRCAPLTSAQPRGLTPCAPPYMHAAHAAWILGPVGWEVRRITRHRGPTSPGTGP